MDTSLLAIVTAILFAGYAHAAEPCALSYEQFEFAVPHVDLETCPKSMATDGSFCRATTASDMLHVFRFEEDGDQCLLQTVSVEEENFSVSVE